ncbi:MAG: hypothetical protein H6Q67_1893, partial [Firmicutes bacterium]|nr:hypothetical protein [Bacillota bacterium]
KMASYILDNINALNPLLYTFYLSPVEDRNTAKEQKSLRKAA